MSAFTAVILVCQLATPPGDCDEARAVDVISTHVDSQFACMYGWQQSIARGALREGVGETLYVKTICRRASPTAQLEK